MVCHFFRRLGQGTSGNHKMPSPKIPIPKMLSPSPKPQPLNPKHINQWHFIHWCFVCGILTGYPWVGLFSGWVFLLNLVYVGQVFHIFSSCRCPQDLSIWTTDRHHYEPITLWFLCIGSSASQCLQSTSVTFGRSHSQLSLPNLSHINTKPDAYCAC
mgnify:FL=1